MSSRRGPGRLLLTVLIAPLLWSACGKKGAPRPPIRLIPQAASDLSIAQKGDTLVLTSSYPNVAANGLALPGLQAVEVWRLSLPAAAVAEGAPPLRQAELTTRGEQQRDLRDAELKSVVVGDRLVIELPLPQLPPVAVAVTAGDDEDDEAGDARTPAQQTTAAYGYGLRFVSTQQEQSDFSNLAVIAPQLPPAAASDLVLEARADGVAVSWQGEGTAGCRVYRRRAEQPLYGRPLATTEAGERSYFDRGARYGQRYVYSVTALAAVEPSIESKIGEEREIQYLDRFAPPPPEGLLALAESDRIRLNWRGSATVDLAGYFVYRRIGGGSFERTSAEVITSATYTDTTPGSGERSYKVTAVDQEGNESAASETASARLADP